MNTDWIFCGKVGFFCILNELFFKVKKKERRWLIFMDILLCIRPWASLDTSTLLKVACEEGNIVTILEMKKLWLRADTKLAQG